MLSVEIYKKLKQRPSSSIAADEFILDVKFEARSGVTILFGASGAGKSMTLKAIAGIVRPERGRIVTPYRVLFDSAQAIDLPIRARQVGYVFQNLALFPHLTALQNVEFAMPQLARRARRERALAALKNFGIEHTAARRPRAISGGEAQRVALARVLASEPQILLLDEPLSALDESTKLTLINDLKNLNRQLQLPVLYVTHSREEALTLGERVIVYEHGRVVAEGEPLDVFRTPASLSIARLTGVENVFDGWVVHQNEAAGTLTIEITGAGRGVCRIDVPYGQQALRERVRIAVRAGDILLATEEPRFTSARNILRGRITAIEEKGDRINLLVVSGVTWVVSVTRQSANDLPLTAGAEVWLAIKTFSCYVLDQ